MRRIPFFGTMMTLVVSLVGAAALGIAVGPMSLTVDQIMAIIWDTSAGDGQATPDSLARTVVFDLRVPRVALAMAIGAILGQCGAVMQGLFRNPLADPGIIGVSAGAAVGAIIAIALMPSVSEPWSVPLSACLGGFVATMMVYAMARSQLGVSTLVLLLAGVVVTLFAGAVINFASYFADDRTLREMSVWQMGSLGGADGGTVLLCALVFIVLAVSFQLRARHMNALLLGEPEARHMGVNVEALKFQLIGLTALGVGVAVASSGIIGFVGLVVPHAVRLVSGPDHRTLLPLSALFGSLVLLLSDVLARLVIQPAELPVGLVTALVGAPLFLMLLQQHKKQLR